MKIWVRLLPAAIALWTPTPRAWGEELPVEFGPAGGEWNPVRVQKDAGPALTFELVATHRGAADRLMVFRASGTRGAGDDLGAFAHRVVDSFTAWHCGPIEEQAMTRMDCPGLDLRFALTGDKAVLDCDLFVFADDDNRWAVLHSQPAGMANQAEKAFAALRRAARTPPGVVQLEPMRIKGEPLTTLALRLEITRTPDGMKVAAITVTDVPPGSAAAEAGIRVGDAIVAIDGRKTVDFSAGVGKDSELGRLFLNRQPGEKISFEIEPPGGKPSFPVALKFPRRIFAPAIDLLQPGGSG